MNHTEYFSSGELKCKGELSEIIDCTSRGSGLQIVLDDHDFCVECILGTAWRKKGTWKYYYKNGGIAVLGEYVILNLFGVPSVKNGIWSIFREDGSLFQYISYMCIR